MLRRPLRLERLPPGPVRDLAEAPAPGPRTPLRQVELLALDFETTGLDPDRDHLLSLGWVPVVGGEVLLREACELTVRPPTLVDVGASAALHGVTDDTVADATPLDQALPRLLRALHGRVLVAHHAPLEVGFLTAASLSAYGAAPPLTAVDTMRLQHRLAVGDHGEVEGSLRLDAARSRYGLPRYRAHHALTDAIAAAELLLAQVCELEARSGRETMLRDLPGTRTRGRAR